MIMEIPATKGNNSNAYKNHSKTKPQRNVLISEHPHDTERHKLSYCRLLSVDRPNNVWPFQIRKGSQCCPITRDGYFRFTAT